MRLIITKGQQSDDDKAEELISGFNAIYVLADKGYDSNSFVEAIEATGAEAVIPARKIRKIMREYDKCTYRARNLVERFFQKMKEFRRIATRYERLAITYEAMVSLAATMVWLS